MDTLQPAHEGHIFRPYCDTCGATIDKRWYADRVQARRVGVALTCCNPKEVSIEDARTWDLTPAQAAAVIRCRPDRLGPRHP